MTHPARTRQGFTLIELLVAMALMTILTGSVVFIFINAQTIFNTVDAQVQVPTSASVGSPLGDSVGTTWGDVVTPDKQKYSTESESSPAQSGTASESNGRAPADGSKGTRQWARRGTW